MPKSRVPVLFLWWRHRLGRLAVPSFDWPINVIRWLNNPHPALGGGTPMEHATTRTGLRRVKKPLTRIKPYDASALEGGCHTPILGEQK